MTDHVVTTVLGDVSPAQLGVTLTHEHCLIDNTPSFQEPDGAANRRWRTKPVEMSMLTALRRRPFNTTLDNLVLNDEDLAIRELEWFRRAGGTSVVDCTSIGLGRDPLALQRIARATGLNIVMGTGFYVDNAHPAWMGESSEDDLALLITREIVVGVEVANAGLTPARCGVIGEIGLSGMLKGHGRKKVGAWTPNEEKVLRAAGRASLETGVPISLHLDAIEPLAGIPAIDLLEGLGLEADRIIVGHLDLIHDLDYHQSIADRGVFVQYDCLGRDHYRDEFGYGHEAGHDSWRTRFAAELIRRGHASQLLFAQDVCMKTNLRTFGGTGYAHVLEDVVPTLLAFGVSRTDLEQVLIENPARALSHSQAA